MHINYGKDMETRLKDIMAEKGIMSKTLAEKMGVSKVTISSLINGKVNNLDTLAAAAEVLGVPVWQLFKEPDEPQKIKFNPVFNCPHCGKPLRISFDED